MLTHTRNTIKSLQLLRGLAVTLVIIAHAIGGISDYGHSYIASFYHFRDFGAVGVDIFFVISGVIMTVITADNIISTKKFIVKRCIKILPLYWTISLFYLVISFTPFLPPVKFAEILETLTVIPIFKSGYLAGPVLFVGWTLAFEFFFYLIFTAALFLNKKQPHLLVFSALLLLVIVGYFFSVITEVHFRFATNPIILEFLLGCICGHFYLSNIKIPNGIIYLSIIVGISLMVYSVINGFGYISMGNTSNVSLNFTRVIKWGIPAFLFVTGLVILEKNKGIKVPGLFITMGNISYSAYLSHFFCCMLATTLCRRAGVGVPDLFIAAVVIFSLFIAYLVYQFVEKPLTSYLNKIADKYKLL